ncbi:MAG TPA: hypothetical protein VMG14_00585 [Thermoplasmata archaeon]|jgi:hypothetical protein|nr:hypothetical protein [Thermoplasmata archaeon]
MSGYANAPVVPGLPLGVAVLAVLTGLVGAFLLFGGILVVAVALFGIASLGWASMFGTGLFAGLIVLLVGAVILAVASGLWDQEMWAYVLAVIVTGAAALWFVARPLWDGGGLASVETLPALVSGVLFVYLLAVKNHFW